MILSDRDIKKYLKSGKIKIKPAPDLEKQLGSASLDLRLGNEFRLFNYTQKTALDLKKPADFEAMTSFLKIKEKETFVLHPGDFVLGVVEEYLEMPPDLAARIDGRSSLGKLGLVIHSTSGHVDPGYCGRLTLEISNIGRLPILLYPQMRICQLVFETLSSPVAVPYNKKKGAKYHGLRSPQESKLDEDK